MEPKATIELNKILMIKETSLPLYENTDDNVFFIAFMQQEQCADKRKIQELLLLKLNCSYTKLHPTQISSVIQSKGTHSEW